MEFAPVLVAVGLSVFFSQLFVVLFERTRVLDILFLVEKTALANVVGLVFRGYDEAVVTIPDQP